MGNIILSAIVAGIPLYILLFLLGVKKTPGHFAAAAAVVSALIVAVAAWGMPAGLAINSVVCGAAFGLFPIVWIVITAIWVYNMTVESGEFEIIKKSGSWFSYGETKLGQGRDGVKKLLEDNPELSAELEAKIMEQIKV